MPQVARFVGLTAWGEGLRFFSIFGVFSFFGFALIYHAYPLMVGRDWYSRTAVSLHFWGTLAGVVVATTALLAAGAAQSAALAVSEGQGVLAHPNVVDALREVSVIGLAIVAASQYALVYNAFRTSRSGPYVDLVARSRATVRGAA
jgi:cytochrome c oxidase cbb3-type subunit I